MSLSLIHIYFDPAEVKAALEDPEKSHADEMLSAAERAASEKMTCLLYTSRCV